MVEMLESRLMPSSLQGLGQAHRERSHHHKQAGPIQPETVANPSFEHAQFASLTADDSVPSGCCSETDPGLPPGVNPKSSNPPITGGQGIIGDSNGKVTGYGGKIDGKTLNPITDKNWQQLGDQTNCSSMVIQLPGGGFGYYHLGASDAGKKGLDAFLKEIKTRLNGQPPSCIRVIRGIPGLHETGKNCADLVTVIQTGLGITVPNDCIMRAPFTTDAKGGRDVPYDTWVDPSGHIHFIAPHAKK